MGEPLRTVGVLDAASIVVGIVVGSGIFFMPSLVAANAPTAAALLGFWLAGGVIAVIGALCYAELATAYPDVGGDYHFLRRAYGSGIGFLFVWGRMTVVQTGALAAASLIGGHYLSGALSVGTPAVYAGLIVASLTGLNIAGLALGRWTQNLLTSAVAAGLILVAGAGVWVWLAGAGAGPDNSTVIMQAGSAAAGPWSTAGLAMVFVLYTYGGWNEAAYLSAEIRPPQRNIAYALLWGVGAVTVIYLMVNLALLGGLGRTDMAGSQVVAADLLRAAAGEPGALFVSFLVVLAVLSTANATIITGARSNYAMGRDYPELFGFMGRWRGASSVPVAALLVQGGISLILIALAPVLFGDRGVEAMVAYTAPVFWFFFFLVGASLPLLRSRNASPPGAFRAPLYPLTPILFCVTCLYMLYSAIAYAGIGSLFGLAVLFAGLPLLAVQRYRGSPEGPA